MQLREMDGLLEELESQGVALHAVTAEPGGSAEVKNRLEQRDTNIRFPVHSDPEHKLLVKDANESDVTTESEINLKQHAATGHSLYIKKFNNATKYGGTYEDYDMVQPALVVVDQSGSIQQVWSWNSGTLRDITPKEEMTPVGAFYGAPLVTIRPVSADVVPSIKENRDVQIKGKNVAKLIAEAFKFKSWSEFKANNLAPLYSIAKVIKVKMMK